MSGQLPEIINFVSVIPGLLFMHFSWQNAGNFQFWICPPGRGPGRNRAPRARGRLGLPQGAPTVGDHFGHLQASVAIWAQAKLSRLEPPAWQPWHPRVHRRRMPQ